jgi:Mn2+/Fe2+ NRAMP family transporter
VVAVATETLFAHGRGIVRILDMAATLEPLAGRFSVALFMTGTLAAGLSSVFPIMMVAPLLIGGWKNGKMEVKTPLFRVICLVAALWGLVVPALGSNPVTVTIAAQISNVFVLPLTVVAVIYLVNRKAVMGANRAGTAMNFMLAAALVFSLAVAYAGVKALIGMF